MSSSRRQLLVINSLIIVSPTTSISSRHLKHTMPEDSSSQNEMVYCMQLASSSIGAMKLSTTMVLLRVTEKSVAIWRPICSSGRQYEKAWRDIAKPMISSEFLKTAKGNLHEWPNSSSDLIQRKYTFLVKSWWVTNQYSWSYCRWWADWGSYFANLCLRMYSRICAAFNAAHFNNWSPETKNVPPWSPKARLWRIRPTWTLSRHSTQEGIG